MASVVGRAAAAAPVVAPAAAKPRFSKCALVTYRIVLLLLISFILVGCQTAYDAPGAIAPYLKREWDVNGERLGALYSAYHLPNIVLAALAGVLIDMMGADVSAVGLSAIVFASTCMMAGSRGFAWMIASRVLLGVGSEALGVAQLALLNQAFDETITGALASPTTSSDSGADKGKAAGAEPAPATANSSSASSADAAAAISVKPTLPPQQPPAAASSSRSSSSSSSSSTSDAAASLDRFPSLAISYAASLIVLRLGTFTMFQVLPHLVNTAGWAAMWLIAGIAGFSFACSVGLLLMQRRVACGALGDEAMVHVPPPSSPGDVPAKATGGSSASGAGKAAADAVASTASGGTAAGSTAIAVASTPSASGGAKPASSGGSSASDDEEEVAGVAGDAVPLLHGQSTGTTSGNGSSSKSGGGCGIDSCAPSAVPTTSRSSTSAASGNGLIDVPLNEGVPAFAGTGAGNAPRYVSLMCVGDRHGRDDDHDAVADHDGHAPAAPAPAAAPAAKPTATATAATSSSSSAAAAPVEPDGSFVRARSPSRRLGCCRCLSRCPRTGGACMTALYTTRIAPLWNAIVGFLATVCSPGLALTSAYLLLSSAALMPFGEISTDLYSSVYKYSDQRAARTSSIGVLVGIAVTAPMGLLLDAYGKRGSYQGLLVAGMMTVMPCHMLLALAVKFPPEAVATIAGAGGAAIGLAAWPLIGLRLHRDVQGRMLGLLTAGQNAIMVGAPLVVGWMRDKAAHGAIETPVAPGAVVEHNSFGPALWLLISLEMVCILLAVFTGFSDGWQLPTRTSDATDAFTPPGDQEQQLDRDAAAARAVAKLQHLAALQDGRRPKGILSPAGGKKASGGSGGGSGVRRRVRFADGGATGSSGSGVQQQQPGDETSDGSGDDADHQHLLQQQEGVVVDAGPRLPASSGGDSSPHHYTAFPPESATQASMAHDLGMCGRGCQTCTSSSSSGAASPGTAAGAQPAATATTSSKRD